MYFFEGEFKSKPKQSYSGNKQVISTPQIVSKNQEERERRERKRYENERATRIQAFIRGCMTRSLQKRYNRDQFDEWLRVIRHELDTGQTTIHLDSGLYTLLSCINNFFRPAEDGLRLVSVCQLLVTTRVKDTLSKWLQGPGKEYVYALGRFVSLIPGFLVSLPADSNDHVHALRLLELVMDTHDESAADNARDARRRNWRLIVAYVVARAYHRHMFAFLRRRLPPGWSATDDNLSAADNTDDGTDNAEENVGVALPPRAAPICDLLLAPLRLLSSDDGSFGAGVGAEIDRLRRAIVRSLLDDVLATDVGGDFGADDWSARFGAARAVCRRLLTAPFGLRRLLPYVVTVPDVALSAAPADEVAGAGSAFAGAVSVAGTTLNCRPSLPLLFCLTSEWLSNSQSTHGEALDSMSLGDLRLYLAAVSLVASETLTTYHPHTDDAVQGAAATDDWSDDEETYENMAHDGAVAGSGNTTAVSLEAARRQRALADRVVGALRGAAGLRLVRHALWLLDAAAPVPISSGAGASSASAPDCAALAGDLACLAALLMEYRMAAEVGTAGGVRLSVHKIALAHAFAYSHNFMNWLYYLIISMSCTGDTAGRHTVDVARYRGFSVRTDQLSSEALLARLCRGVMPVLTPPLPQQDYATPTQASASPIRQHRRLLRWLGLFAHLLHTSLLSLHDAELLGSSGEADAGAADAGAAEGDATTGLVFRPAQLADIGRTCRDAMLGLIELAHPMEQGDFSRALQNSRGGPNSELRSLTTTAVSSLGFGLDDWSPAQRLAEWTRCFHSLRSLVTQLYSRDRRHRFCPAERYWEAGRGQLYARDIAQGRDRTFVAFGRLLSVAGGPSGSRRMFGRHSTLNPRRDTQDSEDRLLPAVPLLEAAASGAGEGADPPAPAGAAPLQMDVDQEEAEAEAEWQRLERAEAGLRHDDLEVTVRPTVTNARLLTVLKEIPFVIPFEQRCAIFYAMLDSQRRQHHLDDPFDVTAARRVRIRRSHLYEDAFSEFHRAAAGADRLRSRLRVIFVNPHGLEEAGEDGGGLTREFLADALATAGDPNRGLFVYTDARDAIYPNPGARYLYPDNVAEHFHFVGRIVGKAIYDGVQVEFSLARFFLAKLVNLRAQLDVDYLHSMDAELYRQLLGLKRASAAEVEAMQLDFTILEREGGVAEMGAAVTHELRPGGANVLVTPVNRIQYIHLLANYKLSTRIWAYMRPFLEGLNELVPLAWLSLFDAAELQLLISGSDARVDLADLRAATRYAQCKPDSEGVRRFWHVCEGLTAAQRGQLLKFVTSCSRQPVFGFKNLYPPFTIQLTKDTDRLPTASTCINLLKLPEYATEDELRQKLLYAITSQSGFELS